MWLKLTGAISTENKTSQLTRDAVHSHPYLWSLYHPRFEDTRADMLASYRKMIIVRHPLERVISTYRDKLEGYTGRERVNFRKYMKERIEEKFGLSSPGDLVSFVDFVRFIVEQDNEELVQLDPHWRSIHQLCNPCAIEYDFIGKFERLREDSTSVLRWLGSEGEMLLPQEMYPTSASNFTAHYLGLLHTDLKQAFLVKYLIDYISFDYALL
ncbi:carbohydrate sulfotransferase 14-like [Cherax quadricarinatus]|uniref:carbohydrate sulfotransferase 14-like n=1 Tax=Cherax quadricarinatus TaxID=27406 RepID=UPI0023786938|nr:carbohydrate sulfotransferase 14-like [Cherax quadricarinatus]XP_053653192.1 carbohydrate sulfotransferase 14-like [Cherax quadricarinatus]